MTLYLTVVSGVLSLLLGTFLAACRVSPLKSLRTVATVIVEVRGSNGALVATPFDGPKLVLDKYGEMEEFETPLPEGIRHQALIEDFSEAIDEGRTPGFDGYDGMLATAIIAGAYRSWESGEWEKAL